MNIAEMQFDYSRMSLDIFVTGCNPPHCVGCHNSELWDFEVGYPYEVFMKWDLGFRQDNTAVKSIQKNQKLFE